VISAKVLHGAFVRFLAFMTGQTPDIFLSYSRQDLGIAGKMAAALKAAGHNVWWDQALKSGEVYDQVTETALREARVVIVLWSKAAVASDWVRSEATVAMQRGALMPVMIEACQRPVMFELRQSADLMGWKGNAKDPRLLAFLGDVARQLTTPATGASAKAAAVAVTAPQSGPNRRLLIGGSAGFLALAAGGFGAWKFMGSKADDGTASVVVLPFANLSGDPGQAFFSDGIAEELRSALSQIRGLKIIGRVTSEQFRDTKDLSATAEKLDVDHVLTGSVRRSPTTIRIGAQLVDGRTGVESWSQSYDQPIGDSLIIQSKIATSVVAALSAQLGKAVGTIVVGGTSNPAAQTLFLKALSILFGNVSNSAQQQGLALIDSALALDADYAEAWALKAHVTSNLSNARSAGEMSSEALAASQRAVALAPESGFVRLALARQYFDRLEMRRAFVEIERGLALAPSNARVLHDAAQTLQPFDPDRSVVLVSAAIALDPLNIYFETSLAQLLLNARRFSEVAAPLKRADLIGASQDALFLKASALLWSGQTANARELVNGMEHGRAKLGLTAMLEARAGNRAASDGALAQFHALDAELKYAWLTAIHAQRGEIALALDAVEAALRAKEWNILWIAQEVAYDPIRKEPRFKAVQDAVIPPDLIVPPKRR
jgi:serine/threonine-protein kinase